MVDLIVRAIILIMLLKKKKKIGLFTTLKVEKEGIHKKNVFLFNFLKENRGRLETVRRVKR